MQGINFSMISYIHYDLNRFTTTGQKLPKSEGKKGKHRVGSLRASAIQQADDVGHSVSPREDCP